MTKFLSKSIELNSKGYKFGLICTSLLVFIFCVSKPFLLAPDSEGYLNMDIYRSMGYPVFLKLFTIFGSYQLYFVKVFQIIFTISSAIYLTNTLKKALQLQYIFLYILYIFLLIPLVYEQKVGNFIISEGIAYPLYLVVIATLLTCFLLDKKKYFYVSLLGLFILIQVRGQFLFIVPLIILTIVAKYKIKLFQLENLKLVLITLLLPFLSIFTDIVFHKTQHNYAETTPFTGIQIVSLPFYISKKMDVSCLKTPTQKAYFSYIYTALENRKILLSTHTDLTINDIDTYYKNYTKIANETLSQKGDLFFKSAKSNNQKTILNDQLTREITLPLIQQNYQLYLKLYFQNITKGIGSAKYLLLILLLFLLATLKIIQTKFTPKFGFIYMSTLAILGNLLIVGLAEPVISRYVFYNNWILVTIVLLLWQNAFTKIDE